MKRLIMKSYYQLKGIGCLVWVPAAILYIMLPCVSYGVYSLFKDMDMLYSSILENSQYICPMFSVWYVLFILYHFVEQPGCEILYVKGRCKLPELALPYILYNLNMLPLFSISGYLFPEFRWLYVKLCGVNLLYVAAVYAVTYIFRSIVPSVTIVLLYSVLVFMEGTGAVGNITYFSDEIHIGLALLFEMIPICIIIGVMLMVGIFANHLFVRKWD